MKHSRIRAILIRTHSAQTFSHFLQVSSSSPPLLRWRRWEHFLLRFPILALLPTETSFRQEHAAWRLSSTAPVQGVAPALPPGTLAPRAGAATAPAHPTLAPESVGESCKGVSSLRGRGYSEKLEHEAAGKWTGEFLLPTELPAFWGPTISPASIAFLPSQNGVSQQAAGKGH